MLRCAACVAGVLRSDRLEAFFVDYGNHEIVSLSAVRAIPPLLARLPAQAVHCSLAGVDGAAPWQDAETERFTALTLQSTLSATFALNAAGDCYAAELYDGETCVNVAFGTETGRLVRRWTPSRGGGAAAARTAVEDKTWAKGFTASQAKRDRFKAAELASGEFVDVVVSYAISPSDFWCHLAAATQKLDVLMDELNQAYAAGGPQVALPLAVDDACCARYVDDENWYRARVVSCGGDAANVEFVDYGNQQSVSVGELRGLGAAFLAPSPYAFHCRLVHISPASGCDWPPAAVDRFNELTTDRKLVGCVVDGGAGGGPYALELVSQGTPVHETLVADGLARSTAVVPVRRQSSSSSASRASSAGGGGGGGASSTFQELRLRTGQCVDVNVTEAASPSFFWCQLTQHSAELGALMADLEGDVAGDRGAVALPRSQQAVGSAVCARFSGDEAWYRAEVIGKEDDGLRVRFVDYGNDEVLPLSELRTLSAARVQQLPAQALKAALVSVTPSSAGAWSPAACTAFEELTVDQNLIAKLVMRTRAGLNMVQLVTPSGGGGGGNEKQVGDALVALGCATSSTQGRARPADREVTPTAASPPPVKPAAQPVKPAAPPVKPAVPVAEETTESPPAVEWKAGQSHKAALSWGVSPGDFHCQLASSSQAMAQLADDMRQYYGGRLAKPLPAVRAGQMCASHYPADGFWYRARVVEVRGERARVLYVDYGNAAISKVTELRRLDAEHCKLPLQAARCRLRGVETPGGGWSEAALSKFSALVAKPFRLSVDSRDNDGVYAVTVMTEGGEDVASAVTVPDTVTAYAAAMRRQPGDKLTVEVCHVEAVDRFWCQESAAIPALDELMNKMEAHFASAGEAPGSKVKVAGGEACVARFSEDRLWYRALLLTAGRVQFVDYGNFETVGGAADVRPLLRDFAALPAQAFECALSEAGPGAKKDAFEELVIGKTLTGVVRGTRGAVTELALTTDAGDSVATALGGGAAMVDVFGADRAMPKDTVEVFVTHKKSTEEFYVQLLSDEAAVADLADALTQEYAALGPADRVMSAPVPVGAACAALYAVDGAWYRARVVGAGDPATLLFVDYGNEEAVEAGGVRRLTAPHLAHAPFALHCRLDAPSDVPLLEAFDAAEDSLRLRFVSGSPPYRVKIVSGDDASAETDGGAAYATGTLPPGRCQVYVSHVADAGEFYLQLVTTETQLNQLLDQIDEAYGTLGEGEMDGGALAVGAPCCAAYSDNGVWYRATLTAVDGDKCSVHFVDYGNSDGTTRDGVKRLEARFLSPAPMSFRCTLGGADGWTDATTDRFATLTVDKILTAEFGDAAAGPPYGVTLRDKDVDVAAALLPPGEEDKSEEAEGTKEETGGTEEEEAGEFAEAAMPSGEVEAYVSTLVSPGEFYLQLSATETSLATLMADLQEACVAAAQRSGAPRAGQPCCARYSVDEQWYRSTVTHVADDDAVAVTFVDYGNSETVGRADMRPLPGRFLAPPPYALLCCLAGVRPEHWSDDETGAFVEHAVDAPLTVAFLRRSGSTFKVTLREAGGALIADLFPDRRDIAEEEEEEKEEEVKANEAAAAVAHVGAEEEEEAGRSGDTNPDGAEPETVQGERGDSCLHHDRCRDVYSTTAAASVT